MSEGKIITAEDILKAVKTVRTEPFKDEDKRVILKGEDYVALVYRIDDQNKIIEKQKAEIERLTEDWKQRINKARQRQFNGLKKEELASAYEKLIESLEDELEHRQNDYMELQKQVEVLTAEKENLYFLNKNLEDYIDNHEPIWKRNTEQAVKDTAREILQGFMKWLKQAINNSYEIAVLNSGGFHGGRNRAFHEVKDLVKKVAESKGIEVDDEN